ncbi:phospholipase D-like domain-containing protein [Falsibacillus pallidus]|uniref:phospholipase D n=1 Tax=Falsibacillus pallidus TaxID=493781 RepID=A0A370GEP1_9BACI|nr:phospholipase D-like domain-containing protein [Falsibacillus pallidus]RDI42275.1 phospholipase D-like protein [Falsibacillus pallidus]
MKALLSSIMSLAIITGTFLIPANVKEASAATAGDVVVNEVAWMGTTTSYNDEWMELYNPTSSDIDLSGWSLKTQDGSVSINLTGTIPAKGYFLLERTDDDTVPYLAADMIYSGTLGNSDEALELYDSQNSLIDSVNAWYAGDNTTKAAMERIDPAADGNSSSNWRSSTTSYNGGYGTPKALNSGSAKTTEHINHVSEDLGAINVYFNKSALTQYASAGNEANYNVNLENRLIKRLNSATKSIDLATYEINLPRIIDTLMQKAAQGVQVRILADAKDATDPNYIERYETMRLDLEKMERGEDGVLGTSDDVHIFSDSPMFAVEDAAKRSQYGLPSDLSDIPTQTVMVGNTSTTGHLFVNGEEKSAGAYYSPGHQMHNKFANIDNEWIYTGSWNFTVTGLYGDDANMEQGILDGNQQHSVEIHSPEMAAAYLTEFNEMWGSSTTQPDAAAANFNTRKVDNTPHVFTIGGKKVELYFSGGDDALGHLANLVKNEADYSAYFTIFAWSDQALVDELKNKWEGSYLDQTGTLTGFDVKGVYDSSYWNQWWSASVEMRGVTASQSSTDNPNTRWNNPAPVFPDNETRKMHAKTMIIDADTTSDPTVVVGSTNWSTNGNTNNDENMLIIHDTAIANQFVQEFDARYVSAGGQVN